MWYRCERVHRGLIQPGFVYGDGPEAIESSLKQTGSDESLLPCARRLVEQQCEAVVWACTSGSFAGGFQWARDQANRLRRETDLPCTSTTLALIEAVHAMDRREVDLLSTYPVFATERLTETLQDAGISVIDSTSVDGATDHSYGKTSRLLLSARLARADERIFVECQPG